MTNRELLEWAAKLLDYLHETGRKELENETHEWFDAYWAMKGVPDHNPLDPIREVWEKYKNGIPSATDAFRDMLELEQMRFYLWMAVKQARKEGAEIKAVPVRVEERYGNEGDRILSMITRNSGKPLSPLETSEVLKRLVAYGWTEEEVAKKTGYGIGQTKNMLSSLPRELTKPIENGQVSASLVVEQVRKRGQDGAGQALDDAIKTAEGKGEAQGHQEAHGRSQAGFLGYLGSEAALRPQKDLRDAHKRRSGADFRGHRAPGLHGGRGGQMRSCANCGNFEDSWNLSCPHGDLSHESPGIPSSVFDCDEWTLCPPEGTKLRWQAEEANYE